MIQKIDQLVVSDEEIAEAAVTFVKLDLERRKIRAVRNEMLMEEACFRRGSKPDINNCFDALKAEGIEKTEFCDNCQKIDVQSQLVRKANAKRNGKLRHLRTLVKRRLDALEKGEETS